MKSFLLSALKKKFAGATLEAFSAAHPHDWLVWEPGGWNPPAKTTMAAQLPTAPPTPKPAPKKGASLSGEALAVALEPRRDGKLLTIGRSEGDFVVNDGTVSQRHLGLHYDSYRWTASDLGSRNGSQLDGIKLGEKPEPLFNGAELLIGSVQLTYYLPSGMHERLLGKPAR